MDVHGIEPIIYIQHNVYVTLHNSIYVIISVLFVFRVVCIFCVLKEIVNTGMEFICKAYLNHVTWIWGFVTHHGVSSSNRECMI